MLPKENISCVLTDDLIIFPLLSHNAAGCGILRGKSQGFQTVDRCLQNCIRNQNI